MSIATFEKPMEHVALEDYNQRFRQMQQTADNLRRDAFELRHSGRQLRNDTNLVSNWNTYFNNMRLTDRLAEVTRWREVLETCLKSVQSEIAILKAEKTFTDIALETVVNTPLTVVSECLTLRDGRHGGDLNHDEAYMELVQELKVVEALKKMLSERCQESWGQLNRLGESEFRLQLDLSNKTDAIEIDSFNLEMDKNCSGTTYKPDPLRIPGNCINYEKWLELSRENKDNMEHEISHAIKLREDMYESRARAFNAMKAQQDATDYAFRRRIYETQRAKNELHWQKNRMLDELTKVKKEIHDLDAALRNKTEAVKLAETRLENRMCRGGPELVQDDAQDGLAKEVLRLRQTQQELGDKLTAAKTLHAQLDENLMEIDADLENKQHSLMTDLRCVDTRERLRATDRPLPIRDQKDTHFSLTCMLDEIPKSIYKT